MFCFVFFKVFSSNLNDSFSYLGHSFWRKCDCIHNSDEVIWTESIKVLQADIVGMKPLCGRLWGLLDEVGISSPEQFLQPDSVQRAGGKHLPILLRDSGSKFGNR